MKTLKELAEKLLDLAELASQGKADAAQAEVLCRATDTLIKLTRLEMDFQFQVRNGNALKLPWIEAPEADEPRRPARALKPEVTALPEADKMPESARIAQLRGEMEECTRQLSDKSLSDKERDDWLKKRQFAADRINFLERTKR